MKKLFLVLWTLLVCFVASPAFGADSVEMKDMGSSVASVKIDHITNSPVTSMPDLTETDEEKCCCCRSECCEKGACCENCEEDCNECCKDFGKCCCCFLAGACKCLGYTLYYTICGLCQALADGDFGD